MDRIFQRILNRDDFGKKLLRELSIKHKYDTILMFGENGEPFWSSRDPITEDDLKQFERAIDQINATEETREKPFLGFDPDGRFSYIALKSSLYAVVLRTQNLKPVNSSSLYELGNEIDSAIENKAKDARKFRAI